MVFIPKLFYNATALNAQKHVVCYLEVLWKVDSTSLTCVDLLVCTLLSESLKYLTHVDHLNTAGENRILLSNLMGC